MSFADHFSVIARTYAAFRPHYPTTLADELANRCSSTELAWDAGCGNGQLSVALAARFEQVIATEPAQAQLDAAERHPHVEYRCEPAERSSLGDGSVDLAVAAQAAHWFDWPGYVAEVARVTRPGALVALVSYGIVDVEGADAAADRRALLSRGRRPVLAARPRARRERVSRPRLAVADRGAAAARDDGALDVRQQLLGYVASWSATVRLVEAKGPAPYEKLRAELAAAWTDGTRTVRWPLTLRLARV